MISKSKQVHFLPDGCDRAYKAMEPVIHREVEEEFTKAWEAAGFFRRWLLRSKINAEIRRRLAERAPRDALY